VDLLNVKNFVNVLGKKISNLRKTLHLIQVPLLVDPNTGVEMLESADIVKYLLKTYKTEDIADESWLEYGINDKKSN